MKSYTQDEVKYKIVDQNGNMICKKYFEDICDAEKEAMSLTDINPRTNRIKADRAFIVCVKSCAEYISYDDIDLTIMTRYTEICHVCRESKNGMIRVILDKYIE